jgi:AraC-like DNA-binding protein
MDGAKLLRGSGIFMEDLEQPDKCISCEQLLQLLNNMQQLSKYNDLALRYGRRLPFSCDSQLLKAFNNCLDLDALLVILKDHNRLYLPLIHLHCAHDDSYHYLCINDAIGLGAHADFFYLAFMSSLVALLKTQQVDSQTLHFFLPNKGNLAELHTYLGNNLHFNAPVAFVALPRQLCQQSFSEPNPLTQQHALNACAAKHRPQDSGIGFLEHLQRHLLHSITREATSLESVCGYYQVSPSTFKRRLKHHHTHFQIELDNAKKLLALAALLVDGLSSEATAERLGISDLANFRRACKRWTGLAPSHLKKRWG